jgi:hypothetical protein
MDDAMRAQALDYLLAFIIVASLVIGLGSMLAGRVVSLWDSFQAWRSVNKYQAVMSPTLPAPAPDGQTDETDRRPDAALSEHDSLWQEFCVDRTRARLIAVMVDSQIPVAAIRGLLKGDNTVISQEVEAARKQLGLAPVAPYVTPIAGRPTRASFYQDDPDLQFHPPPR